MRRTLLAGLTTAVTIFSGFGLAAGTAYADNQGPYQWCLGQDMVFSAQTGVTGRTQSTAERSALSVVPLAATPARL